MSTLKKVTAVLSAVMMSATLFGCADTSYILKADGEEVKSGVYINYASTELQNQIYTLQADGLTSNFLDQKVDDKDMSEYIADKAMTSTKEYAAINAKFDELGLKLDEETVKSINSNINDAWDTYKDDYEKRGISKESVKNVQKASSKRQQLFDYYYAKDGKEAVSDDELTKYVEENYLRYKVLSIPKATAAATDESSEADDSSSTVDENKELFDKYLKEAKKLDFDSFDKVIDEYQKYQEDQQAATSTESSVPELEDTASVADTTEESADDTSSTDESADSEAAESTAESTADAADESSEEDKYPNEQLTNYSTLDEDSFEEAYGKVLKEIKEELKVDEVSSFEDDNYYYIYVKGDIKGRSKEYAASDENRETLLSEMKGDDFQKKIDEWVEKIKFEINDKAVERYSAEELYDKMKEDSSN